MKSKKQLIIIFEGHDCAGKSNIAKELSRHLKMPLHKRHGDKKRWFDTCIDLIYGVDSIVDLLEDTGISIILDRFYPSEYVYAKTFNRALCENKLFEIDERMSKLNTIIIHCYKNKENWQKDKHQIIDKNLYKKIIDYYRGFSTMTKCKFMEIDTSDKNLKRQINLIKTYIKEIMK